MYAGKSYIERRKNSIETGVQQQQQKPHIVNGFRSAILTAGRMRFPTRA